ncbi:hypothetical protein ES319_A04G000700v1 [Gossypium barbadense]|uniref:Calcineurin-like phosphoesterase domain-containing protein n=1 Tax=Gossypium barbadense TaxID=3634 RepID=A0A5J5W3X1_GOSBA|nr:hypothetical protein ES319_A04G000700v1 [Gossypium barbadense]
MKIAVEGCMHGDLDKVYDTFKYIENTRNIKIDLLLCYGDFQIVSFLELLDLPYVLDNASDSRDTPSLSQKDDYSEDIPNEDEDDLEDDAERNNENRSSGM